MIMTFLAMFYKLISISISGFVKIIIFPKNVIYIFTCFCWTYHSLLAQETLFNSDTACQLKNLRKVISLTAILHATYNILFYRKEK